MPAVSRPHPWLHSGYVLELVLPYPSLVNQVTDVHIS